MATRRRRSLLFAMAAVVIATTLERVEGSRRRASRSSIPGAVLQYSVRMDRVVPPLLNIPANKSPHCETRARDFRCRDGEAVAVGQFGVVCLWRSSVSMNFTQANNTCQNAGGHLVTIRSEAKQKKIEDFLRGTSSWYWMGLFWKRGDPGLQWYPGLHLLGAEDYQPPDFLNSHFTVRRRRYYSKLCGILTDSQGWTTESCSQELNFICERPADCGPGLFGPFCEQECHCHGEKECLKDHCQFGCQPGWMGPLCCAKKRPAEVTHYCFNNREEGRHLLVRLDAHDAAYDVSLTNIAWQPISWSSCSHVTTKNLSDSTYLIKISVPEPMNSDEEGTTQRELVLDSLRLNSTTPSASTSSSLDSEVTPPPLGPCGEQKVKDNMYTWRMTLRENAKVRMRMDRRLQMTCDFKQADTMRRKSDTEAEEKKDVSVETVSTTEEDVTLRVIDPSTSDVITQARLEDPVALKLQLRTSTDSSLAAQGVAPFNCAVTSTQGHYLPLTDQHGCGTGFLNISHLGGCQPNVTSSSFPLFAFPETGHVSIVCSFRFCFGSTEPDECGVRGPGRYPSRRRRQATEDEPRMVRTEINVLPRADASQKTGHEAKGHQMRQDQVRAAQMMTPVTWVLFTFLLVISAALVHVMLCRRTREPMRKLRIEQS